MSSGATFVKLGSLPFPSQDDAASVLAFAVGTDVGALVDNIDDIPLLVAALVKASGRGASLEAATEPKPAVTNKKDEEDDEEEIPTMRNDTENRGQKNYPEVGDSFEALEAFSDTVIEVSLHLGRCNIHRHQDKARVFFKCDNRVTAGDMEQECGFHCRAYWKGDHAKVTSFIGHTCNILQEKKEVQGRFLVDWMTRRVEGFVSATPDATPRQIQALVKERYGVDVSYSVAYRARERLFAGSLDNTGLRYGQLQAYFDLLKQFDPDCRTVVKHKTEANGDRRFVFAFMALGPCVAALQAAVPLLSLDGTHILGFKGTLLTAVGLDANGGGFPAAFALCSTENAENWDWFLDEIARIRSNFESTISDRDKGLKSATENKDRALSKGVLGCVNHIAKNAKHGFGATAKLEAFRLKGITKKTTYAKAIKDLQKKQKKLAEYLDPIRHLFVDAYIPSCRYNQYTNNLSESYNSTIKGARESKNVIDLFDRLRQITMGVFSTRRASYAKCQNGQCSPSVAKRLTRTLLKSQTLVTQKAGEGVYEVATTSKSDRQHVTISEYDFKCSCREAEVISGLPCIHVAACTRAMGRRLDELVPSFFKVAALQETYSGIISPMPLPELSNNGILPPLVIKQKGRPRTKRISSRGEDEEILPEPPRRQVTCQRCLEVGHNRATCPNPPAPRPEQEKRGKEEGETNQVKRPKADNSQEVKANSAKSLERYTFPPHISEVLETTGLQVKDVPRDGNCFYHCLINSVFPFFSAYKHRNNGHSLLRQHLFSQEVPMELCKDSLSFDYKDFETWKGEASKNRFFADSSTIFLASCIYQVQIVCVSVTINTRNNPDYSMTTFKPPNPLQTIHLLHEDYTDTALQPHFSLVLGNLTAILKRIPSNRQHVHEVQPAVKRLVKPTAKTSKRKRSHSISSTSTSSSAPPKKRGVKTAKPAPKVSGKRERGRLSTPSSDSESDSESSSSTPPKTRGGKAKTPASKTRKTKK